MKNRNVSTFFINSLLLAVLFLGTLCQDSVAATHVADTRGTAEPAFLSYGIKSNLLMLLDNSGSMLDTAYVDKDTDGTGPDTATQCFDSGYVPTNLANNTLYAGPFTVYEEDTAKNKTELWYKWVDVQPLWEHKIYNVDDRVYENGIIYQALSVTGVASSGTNIYEDNKVEWVQVTRPVWKTDTYYHSKSFVYNSIDGHLYYTANGGTSAGTLLTADTGVTDWQLIPSWKNGVFYAAGAYVEWEDVIYHTLQGGTTSGTKPWDDEEVLWVEVNPFEWKSSTDYKIGDVITFQGMIFKAQTDHYSSGLTLYETGFNSNWLRMDGGYYEQVTAVEAQAVCTAGAGTKYTASGLCLARNVVAGAPSRISAFAASGNFMNWLMASKFDIQKSILTGGKYNADVKRVVSENRGCSGSRFVKQVTLNTGDFLTLSVRGPRKDGDPFKKDRVDGSDDTTRIEVLAISTTGYNPAACQNAIDTIFEKGLNGAQNEIDTCLVGTGTTADARTALNHAMQYCWQSNPSVKVVVDDCKKVYDGMSPIQIANWSNAYNCYGIYDNHRVHKDRVGYVGRCYETGSGSGSKCEPYPRVSSGSFGCDWSVTSPCEFWNVGKLYRNRIDFPYTEICTNLNRTGTVCQNNNSWNPYYTVTQIVAGDGLTLGSVCNPLDNIFTNTSLATPWSRDIDGIPGFTASDTSSLPVPLPPELVPNNTGLDKEAAYCVYEAMEKYCSDLEVPEVIDPTDQATSTSGEYGNIPALLVDSGVLSKLGIDVPMNVMQGHIKRETAPKGILQKAASDLRIGAMAFNSVGALTECQAASPTSMIVKYCPSTNQDGARVIKEIKLGSTVTSDNGTTATNDDRTHVDDLAEAINDVRATSWTPLAEAMYNAIGYYTQNKDMRLNPDDFLVDGEPGASDKPDPVTNWCQSNNILIITEGASSADINVQVKNFVTGSAIVSDGDTEITCTDGLDGSTYLDDLTNHAQNASASQLYPSGKSQLQTSDGDWKDKQNITTYVVASGGLRGSVGDDECTPAALINNAATNGGTTLYDSGSPEQLEEDLLAIFNALRQRASSGSAASVISSSRGGEGAIYQAIFWPEIKRTDADGNEHTVAWTGDVHTLFVDSRGYMYEDTDGDHAMTSSDKRVIIYFDEVSGKSKACYNTENWLGTCLDTPVDIQDVQFIWSAGKWLSDTDLTTSTNRSTYLSNDKKRYVYTWNDLNNDGIVDRNITNSEWLPFQDTTGLAGLSVDTSRSSVAVDFDVVTDTLTDTQKNAKVNDIVNWVRGEDRLFSVDLNANGSPTDDGEAPLRSRKLPATDGSATMVTARLGDIIHSTPMTVSSPAEGFHLLYNDYSYAEFAKQYKSRRHVIYFGSNDGMLHAVNGGFYNEAAKKFCLTKDCTPATDVPELGAELWAYVPYNLLPHLSSLTNPDYNHKYYVDLRPRIFDVQIFPDDATHPNGWGTILVGGMRLGGAPINATELNGSNVGDTRQFISSYFIFDITDPEQEPVLLGEMTRRQGEEDIDLGHSLAIPTMVIMKEDKAPTQTTKNQWYLVFGSGPHAPIGSNNAMKGVSDQKPRLGVLPLDWLVKTPKALRIPNAAPSSADSGGTFVLNDSAEGFTSDLITIDGDINPSSASYMADAVYFGTNEGNYAAGWRGQIYRLMTRDKVSGEYLFGKTITQEITTPEEWTLSVLMNVGQPVSSAPSIGYDGYNFWLYVGTGRFFDGDDRTDATQQSFYGIKEPLQPKATGGIMEFLGTEVVAPTVHGGPPATWPVSTESSGNKGLLKVDEIRVAQSGTPETSELSCWDHVTDSSGGTGCLPPEMVSKSKTKLSDLTHYIADPDPVAGAPDNLYNSTDGWYVDFYPYGNRERNLGQATMFGGLVTFTTYQPFLDPCQAEGKSYLYSLYYKTGTAWHKKIYGELGLYENNQDVREKLDLGRGLSTTPNLHVSGDGDSVTAMVQTSTGVILEQKQDEVATDDYFTGRTGWKECTE